MLRNWCAGAWLACCAPLALGSPALPARPFVYSTAGSSLSDVLDALGRATQVPVRIDGTLRGLVIGRYDLRPAQFLDVLSESFGLLWYYDGAVIHVSAAGARNTIAMRLNYASARGVAASLAQEGLADARMPLAADDAHNTLSVSGPPDYTARIVSAVRHIEDAARARVPTTVRLVPLVRENAADRTLGGSAGVAPGLATRLTWRVHGGPGGANAPIAFDAPLPIFTADAATNSILIRDRTNRLDDDEALVERFDTKPKAIALQAYIFDLAEPAFDALPLERAQRQSGAFVVQDGAAPLLAQVDAFTRTGEARACVQRNLVTIDHAPVTLSCAEATLAALPAARDGNAHPAHAPCGSTTPTRAAAERDDETSVVIEPDLDGKGSASLFQLATTLDDTQAFGTAAPNAHRNTARATHTDMVPGDALVLIGRPQQGSAPHRGARRLVILVPHVIDG